MNRANLPIILNYYASKAEADKKHFYEKISLLNKKKEDLELTIKLTSNPVQEILNGRDPLEIASEEQYNETATLAINLLNMAIEKIGDDITAAGIPVQQKISLIQTSYSGLCRLKEAIITRSTTGDPVTPYQKTAFEAQRNALMLLIRDLPAALLKDIKEDIEAMPVQAQTLSALIAA